MIEVLNALEFAVFFSALVWWLLGVLDAWKR